MKPAVALVLSSLFAGCNAGQDGTTTDPPRNASIVIVSPSDGAVLGDEDDEDDVAAGFQVTVTCAVSGLDAGEPILLTLRDDRYDVSWDHHAVHDGSETLVFPGVVFWPGDELMAGTYTLLARSERWDIAAQDVSVQVVSLSMDAAVPGYWETDCSSCQDDSGCDDGLACNGREVCAFSQYRGEFCCYTNEIFCAPPDGCTMAICSEATGGCTYLPLDEDGDGHGPTACGHDDCDDHLYSVHPGAAEKCDAVDNDCDGAIDESAWVPTGSPSNVGEAGSEPRSPALVAGTTSWGLGFIDDHGPGSCAVTLGAITPSPSGPSTSTVEGCIDERPVSGMAMTACPPGFAYVLAIQDGSTEVHAGLLGPTGDLDGAADLVISWPAAISDMALARSDTGTLGLTFRSDAGGDYELFFVLFTLPVISPLSAVDVVRLTDSVGFSGHPSIVGTASGFAVAWEDERDGDSEIYFEILDDEGIASGPQRRITTAPGASERVTLAASHGGFALAWMDSRDGGYDMLFTCLDSTGVRACPELELGGGPLMAWYPALSPDGHEGQYALAFAGIEESGFALHLSAVSLSGAILPTSIDQGQTLTADALSMHSICLADTSGYRGVLWMETFAGSSSVLRFSQLTCGDGT